MKKVANTNPNPVLYSSSVILSFLCAIHCMAMPFFIAFLSFFGVSYAEHPALEAITLIVIGTIAAYALYNGYQRHGKIWPTYIFAFGFAIMILAVICHLHALTAVGASFVAIGQISNWRISQKMAKKANNCC